MQKFIGRKNELSLIEEALKKTSASIMVYGKRKVGKTTLIKYALKNSKIPTVYYECLKASEKENVSGFVNELVRNKIFRVYIPFDSFVDVFSYIKTLNKPMNIVIDEYPYLKEFEKPQIVDSKFQKIIDNYTENIHLFISGSHIGIMKDMLQEKNALYGRFSLTIQLKELNYKEAAEFYPQKPVYEKIGFYSVFGGSPFVNGFLDSDKDLKTNIINTVLNENSAVFNYADNLLISDFSKSLNAERIMFAVANGKKKYSDIENALNMNNNGLLSKHISSLLDMEILSKSFPINKSNNNKKVYYELCDNLLRFYFAFIYKNKSALTMLGAEAFYKEYIEKPLITFISFRFEEICRSYFSLLAKNGKLPGVTNIGVYSYDDSTTHTSGEFDVVLQRKDVFDIYEVKYYSEPLSDKDVEAEADKIRRVKGLTLGKIGFISVNGFESTNKNYVFLSGKDLY